jgi:hypothetical protein
MLWDVVMLGSLSVPQQRLDEWLGHPLSRDLGWLEAIDGRSTVHATPEALLEFLREACGMPHEIFDVQLVDARLSVQCYVSQNPFLETSRALALVFASAAAFGAIGELVIYGYRSLPFGQRLIIGDGCCDFRQLDSSELQRLERRPALIQIEQRIQERFDGLVERQPTPSAAPRSHVVIHPFTHRFVDHHEEILTRKP